MSSALDLLRRRLATPDRSAGEPDSTRAQLVRKPAAASASAALRAKLGLPPDSVVRVAEEAQPPPAEPEEPAGAPTPARPQMVLGTELRRAPTALQLLKNRIRGFIEDPQGYAGAAASQILPETERERVQRRYPEQVPPQPKRDPASVATRFIQEGFAMGPGLSALIGETAKGVAGAWPPARELSAEEAADPRRRYLLRGGEGRIGPESTERMAERKVAREKLGMLAKGTAEAIGQSFQKTFGFLPPVTIGGKHIVGGEFAESEAQMYEHPFEFATNLLVFPGIARGIVTKAGAVAAGLEAARAVPARTAAAAERLGVEAAQLKLPAKPPGTIETVARGIENVGKVLSDTEPAKTAIRTVVNELARRNPPIESALRRVDELVGEHITPRIESARYARAAREHRRTLTEEAFSWRRKINRETQQAFAGLSKDERSHFYRYVMALEPLPDNPSPALEKAYDWWSSHSAQWQLAWMAANRLTPETAWMRRYQPLRIEKFGFEGEAGEAALQKRRRGETFRGINREPLRSMRSQPVVDKLIRFFQMGEEGKSKKPWQSWKPPKAAQAPAAQFDWSRAPSLSPEGMWMRDQLYEAARSEGSDLPLHHAHYAIAALEPKVKTIAKDLGIEPKDWYAKALYGATGGWADLGDGTVLLQQDVMPVPPESYFSRLRRAVDNSPELAKVTDAATALKHLGPGGKASQGGMGFSQLEFQYSGLEDYLTELRDAEDGIKALNKIGPVVLRNLMNSGMDAGEAAALMNRVVNDQLGDPIRAGRSSPAAVQKFGPVIPAVRQEKLYQRAGAGPMKEFYAALDKMRTAIASSSWAPEPFPMPIINTAGKSDVTPQPLTRATLQKYLDDYAPTVQDYVQSMTVTPDGQVSLAANKVYEKIHNVQQITENLAPLTKDFHRAVQADPALLGAVAQFSEPASVPFTLRALTNHFITSGADPQLFGQHGATAGMTQEAFNAIAGRMVEVWREIGGERFDAGALRASEAETRAAIREWHAKMGLTPSTTKYYWNNTEPFRPQSYSTKGGRAYGIRLVRNLRDKTVWKKRFDAIVEELRPRYPRIDFGNADFPQEVPAVLMRKEDWVRFEFTKDMATQMSSGHWRHIKPEGIMGHDRFTIYDSRDGVLTYNSQELQMDPLRSFEQDIRQSIGMKPVLKTKKNLRRKHDILLRVKQLDREEAAAIKAAREAGVDEPPEVIQARIDERKKLTDEARRIAVVAQPWFEDRGSEALKLLIRRTIQGAARAGTRRISLMHGLVQATRNSHVVRTASQIRFQIPQPFKNAENKDAFRYLRGHNWHDRIEGTPIAADDLIVVSVQGDPSTTKWEAWTGPAAYNPELLRMAIHHVNDRMLPNMVKEKTAAYTKYIDAVGSQWAKEQHDRFVEKMTRRHGTFDPEHGLSEKEKALLHEITFYEAQVTPEVRAERFKKRFQTRHKEEWREKISPMTRRTLERLESEAEEARRLRSEVEVYGRIHGEEEARIIERKAAEARAKHVRYSPEEAIEAKNKLVQDRENLKQELADGGHTWPDQSWWNERVQYMENGILPEAYTPGRISGEGVQLRSYFPWWLENAGEPLQRKIWEHIVNVKNYKVRTEDGPITFEHTFNPPLRFFGGTGSQLNADVEYPNRFISEMKTMMRDALQMRQEAEPGAGKSPEHIQQRAKLEERLKTLTWKPQEILIGIDQTKSTSYRDAYHNVTAEQIQQLHDLLVSRPGVGENAVALDYALRLMRQSHTYTPAAALEMAHSHYPSYMNALGPMLSEGPGEVYTAHRQYMEVPAVDLSLDELELLKGPTRLFQKPYRSMGGIKGAAERLADLRWVIRAFRTTDVTTLVHELAHVIRNNLSPRLLRHLEEVRGITNGVWTVADEEWFARGWERFLKDGRAPDQSLFETFRGLSEWIGKIYGSSGLRDADVSPGLRKFFHTLMGFDTDPNVMAAQPYPLDKLFSYEQLGPALKARRLAFGMTEEEAAARAGVTVARVQAIEAGAKPSRKEKRKMASALRLERQSVSNFEPAPRPTPQAPAVGSGRYPSTPEDRALSRFERQENEEAAARVRRSYERWAKEQEGLARDRIEGIGPAAEGVPPAQMPRIEGGGEQQLMLPEEQLDMTQRFYRAGGENEADLMRDASVNERQLDDLFKGKLSWESPPGRRVRRVIEAMEEEKFGTEQNPPGGAGGTLFQRSMGMDEESVAAMRGLVRGLEEGSALHTLADRTAGLAEDLMAQGREAPMYFPFLRRVRPGDFLPTQLDETRRFRPKSMKLSTGATYTSDAFIKDPRVVASKQYLEIVKFTQAEELIRRVMDDQRIPKRIYKGEVLGPNEELFAPDGFLALYRQALDFGDDIIEYLDRFGFADDAAAQALRDAAARGDFTKTAVGVSKAQVYVMPKSVMKELRSQWTPAPKWVRLLIDRPTDWWVTATLAGRPAWIVNNVLGNVIFSLLGGTGADDYLRAMLPEFIAKTPEDAGGSLAAAFTTQVGEYTHLGRHADSVLGNLISYLESTPPATAIGKAADTMFAFNAGLESYFRRANYIHHAEKVASKKYLRRTGDLFFKAYDLLQEMDTFTPDEVKEAVAATNRFMGQYLLMRPWERQWFRRVVRFYSFMKHQTQLVMGMPLYAPGRTALLSNLTQVATEMAEADSAPLPDYLKNKGLIDTGVSITAGDPPRPLRVFANTQGWNPLIAGFATGSEGIRDLSDLPRLIASQGAPITQYAASLMTRRNSMGQAFTEPGTVEVNGRFWRKLSDLPGYTGTIKKEYFNEGVAEVEPPIPTPWEFYAGSYPQVQLARRLMNPRSGFTAEPFSAETPRIGGVTERTRLTELMRYFGVSFVLVDTTQARALPVSRSTLRSIIRKQAQQARAREGGR